MSSDINLMAYYEMQGERLDVFMEKVKDDYYKYYIQTAEHYWKCRRWYLRQYLCDFASFCNTPRHIRQLDDEYYKIHEGSSAFDPPWPFNKKSPFEFTKLLDEVNNYEPMAW